MSVTQLIGKHAFYLIQLKSGLDRARSWPVFFGGIHYVSACYPYKLKCAYNVLVSNLESLKIQCTCLLLKCSF